MTRIFVVHWRPEEAEAEIEALRGEGFEVWCERPANSSVLKSLRANPPDVVIIDLSRLPSQGRDFGIALRSSPATRRIPLIFAGGDPAKIEGTRSFLPDACYSTWEGMGRVVREAIDHPVQDPVVHRTALDAYSKTPLPKKLGIKSGFGVAMIDPPDDVLTTLAPLPGGAEAHVGFGTPYDLILWFVRSSAELEQRIGEMYKASRSCPMWILWQKKSSGMESGLTQQIVRRVGLESGLVDYKICSFDSTWSGLLFKVRSKKA